MPYRATRMTAEHAELTRQFSQIREDLEISLDFSEQVEAEAAAVAASVELPESDALAIAFVTIDPEGSKDLDQALAIERDENGYVVYYAIADVARVVIPGGAIDTEAHVRGQTMYAPDQSAPLHPRTLSEDAASLLPGVVRSAYVWRLCLDEQGNVASMTLTRSQVRSREQLSYPEAQRRADAGDELMGLLREVGERRIALESVRGGASLDMPDEEIELVGNDWTILRREMSPVEQWNAQISLMTGMEAARLQLQAGRGILRTMPKPSADAMAEFRNEVREMGIPFAADEQYGEFLRRLDRANPTTAAVLDAARSLFRGAGYLVLKGGEDPDTVIQSAIGAPYAHATAPLRRLVDRYVLAHCEAIANGREIEQWAQEGLASLAKIMQASSQKASALERECLAAVTAVILAPMVGQRFDAIIVERRDERAEIEIMVPPVTTSAVIEGKPGTTVRVTLEGIVEGKPVFVAR